MLSYRPNDSFLVRQELQVQISIEISRTESLSQGLRMPDLHKEIRASLTSGTAPVDPRRQHAELLVRRLHENLQEQIPPQVSPQRTRQDQAGGCLSSSATTAESRTEENLTKQNFIQ